MSLEVLITDCGVFDLTNFCTNFSLLFILIYILSVSLVWFPFLESPVMKQYWVWNLFSEGVKMEEAVPAVVAVIYV